MGLATAGKWFIGLILYFFLFYLFIIAVILVGNETDMDVSDIKVSDPGFQSELTPFSATGECGGSLPLSSASCFFLEIDDNRTCTSISGCSWDGTGCTGVPNLSPYGGGCSDSMNETFCKIIGCTWVEFNTGAPSTIDKDDKVDFSRIKSISGILTGFSAELGIPAPFNWIYQFLFLYLPFTIMIISLYLLLPFIH